jgi:hypothetical protein
MNRLLEALPTVVVSDCVAFLEQWRMLMLAQIATYMRTR